MQDTDRFGTRTETYPGSEDERLRGGSVNPSHSCGIRLGLAIRLSWKLLELKV